jgi:exopolyphosphatase/guanosine-5'-triphosphate,3'-diphosphate pyrophosphatase
MLTGMACVAAIDVGSNSIRHLIAEVLPSGRTLPVRRDREVVRLGTGVFRDGQLGPEATEHACSVLERMSDANERYGVDRLRAVGTSALRDATNQREFVSRASSILEVPLDVIDGFEEARLVHRGVVANRPYPNERVLIVDIGGGSAQLILSDNDRLTATTSLPLGAVRLTERFALSGRPPRENLVALSLHVGEQLGGFLTELRGVRLDRVVGTSATAGAVVGAVHGIKRSKRLEADGLVATRQQVVALLAELVVRDALGRADIPGVGKRRAEVIVAGATVLHEILSTLNLSSLQYSSAGVPDGIVADLARTASYTDSWHVASARSVAV